MLSKDPLRCESTAVSLHLGAGEQRQKALGTRMQTPRRAVVFSEPSFFLASNKALAMIKAEILLVANLIEKKVQFFLRLQSAI